MTARAVAVYDLSTQAGYAIYHPDLDEPVFGTCRLPATTETGSVGPAMHLLFDHICWIHETYALAAIGAENFLAPTGGQKDEKTKFTTSPRTIKRLVGMQTTLEMCASMIGIEAHSIHNASWRKYWLGSQKRGTQREEWKRLSVEKANGFGWAVKNDDEADALGQLHFLLNKLSISPRWGRNPSKELIQLGYMHGVPIHV